MNTPGIQELRKNYARRSRRWPVWLRLLTVVATIFVLWVLLGFFAAPPLLRTQIEKRLATQLRRPVTLDRVRFNPLTLSVALSDFAVAQPDGRPFVGWRRLLIDFDSFSLFTGEWRFQEIALDGLAAEIAVAKDGKINFDDLLPAPRRAGEPAASEKKHRPVRIGRLAIDNARIDYTDASRAQPFSTRLGPVSVLLFHFHTGGPAEAPGDFSATTESGETFSWHGSLSLTPLQSSGDVKLGKVALKKYAPFYRERVRFDLLDGMLDASLHYDASVDGGRLALRLSNGNVGFQDVKLARRGEKEPAIALGRVALSGLAADIGQPSVKVARVAVAGGSVDLRRDEHGFDLARLFEPVTASPPTIGLASAQKNPRPLQADVGEIVIHGVDLALEDRTFSPAVRQRLSDVNVSVRNFSLTNPAAPLPVDLRARLVPDGTLHVGGTVALSPFKAALVVEAQAVQLAGFSSYAEPFARLRIDKGSLTTSATVEMSKAAGQRALVTAHGDLLVADFDARDSRAADSLISWRGLSIKALEYRSAPARLLAAEIEWIEPSGHLVVEADRTLNLAAIFDRANRPAPAISLPGTRASSQGEPVFIALDNIAIRDAAISFRDRSVDPDVRVSLTRFSGEIQGLASSDLARASVNLQGTVDGVAPVAITGQINPLSAQAFTDLKVVFRNVELAPFAPYVRKYAGYDLARGSLSLDIRCRVQHRKVNSADVLTLNQFTLGAPTDSPDATKLPVTLALALLRDTAGKIVIDVPVQGNLDDPTFRVGRVVLRVITNLLTKAATSPFSIIGAAFGGGKAEELGYQEFAAGSSELGDASREKLDVVAKALRERPSLRLEIAGLYDPAADDAVLRERGLIKQLQNMVWEERRLSDPSLVTPEMVKIAPAEVLPLVRRLYFVTFPSTRPRRSAARNPFMSPPPSEPGPTVPAQRGNLGSFRRAETPADPTPPAPPPGVVPDGISLDQTPAPAAPAPLPSTAEMKEIMLERVPVSQDVLHELAAERGQRVRDYLVHSGKVPAERLFLVNPSSNTAVASGARVNLTLK